MKFFTHRSASGAAHYMSVNINPALNPVGNGIPVGASYQGVYANQT